MLLAPTRDLTEVAQGGQHEVRQREQQPVQFRTTDMTMHLMR